MPSVKTHSKLATRTSWLFIPSNSKSYIARSALTSFLREISQSYEEGIKGLTIEFADSALTKSGCNWIVVSVDQGTVDAYRACCIVATVERANSGWVMVEDGSDLDGQPVEWPAVLH